MDIHVYMSMIEHTTNQNQGGLGCTLTKNNFIEQQHKTGCKNNNEQFFLDNLWSIKTQMAETNKNGGVTNKMEHIRARLDGSKEKN